MSSSNQSEDGRASAVERLTSRDIVGARLEQPVGRTAGRYHLFFDYGDAEGYHGDLMALRDTLRPMSPNRPRGGKRGEDARYNQ